VDDERRGQQGGAVRRILSALAEQERSVGEITRLTGLSQPNVSNHLARLRRRGWVQARRHGRQVHYSLAQPEIGAAGRVDDPLAFPLTAHPAFLALENPDFRWGAGKTSAGHLSPAPSCSALAAEYLAALLRLDESRAAAVVGEALAHGLHWKAINRRVMIPALVRVGELWAEGELTVAEEHAATAITTRLHERLTARIPAPVPPVGRAVVAGVTGNQHALGVRMVADTLAEVGWEVHYLGTDLPTEDLLLTVQRLRPDAVLLGVTLADQVPALRHTVARLREWRAQQPDDTRLPLLIAGGQYFASGAAPEPNLDLQGTEPEPIAAELTERLAAISAADS
jgi:methanogenic corrinoid protein MtbC1